MTAKKSLPNDPDLANVEKALKRAGKAARELARKTYFLGNCFQNCNSSNQAD